MKSVNAKRIAALAASVALGIAFAAPVSFSSIPIVNSAGQPVVQVVVGSTAQPSDGVVAANIAAVIGNLAFTSTPVTATVGGTSQLSCAVTAPSCSLSNQQVWLGEQGSITAAGSYSFKGLIGSVLNAGVLNYNTLSETKTLQGTGQYTYPQTSSSPYPIVSNPTATSPFTGVGPISLSASVTSSVNGGGVQFTRITQTGGYDNIARFSSAQVPGLMQNSGSYQESEYLWAMGFPVYDQDSSVNNLAVLDAGAAYQVTFGNPIQISNNGNVNHASFQFDGSNWTIFNATLPNAQEPSSSDFVTGGKLQLASASTPLETVYVGQNLTSGPVEVTLQDLSYPDSNGISDAALAVYNNGVLTNETSIAPGTSLAVNTSGTKVYLYVSQTFPGLYSYQKWAKVQLFSSITNVTNGKVFNNEPGWYSEIWWTTNQSTAPSASFSSSNFAADANAAIAGLVLYSNQSTTTTLTPGSTEALSSNYKLTFAGDSLGTPGSGNSNYDPLTLSVSNTNGVTYANPKGSVAAPNAVYTFNALNVAPTTNAAGTVQKLNTTVITEPVDWFTVASSSSTAFQVQNTGDFPAPSSSSTVQYDLDGYQFFANNAIDSAGVANVLASGNGGIYAALTDNGLAAGNYVSNNNQFTVTVTGYKPGSSSSSSAQLTFNGFGQVQTDPGFAIGNVSNVELSYAVPNGVHVQVFVTSNTAAPTGNSVLLGTLSYAGPLVLYNVPQYNYYQAPFAASANVLYTLESSTNLQFTLNQLDVNGETATSAQNYFTYTMPEITVPQSTTASANVIVGLYNSSTILSNPTYWLNQTNGNNNDLEYQSSQGYTVKAPVGFRTERGGEVASISTGSVTYDMAEAVDTLQFLVGPSSSTVSTTTANYGPYGVGQATNIPNVTIAQVNATCSFAASSTSCAVISGVANLTATPSVSSAEQAVGLDTSVTPLAVLDSQANNASTLVVVGSSYVNSVAQQIFAQNPGFASSFGPSSVVVQAFGTNRILVAGYSANQTVQAGNQFIEDLLQSAAAGQ